MDYSLSDEQEAFRRSVRSFLREECPLSLVRQWEKTPEGYDPATYRRVAALGWLGLRLPDRLGGQDAGWIEEIVLYDELGRGLLPGPHFTTGECAHLIAAFGTPEQQNAIVPPLANGVTTAALALIERGAGSNLRRLSSRATKTADGYLVTGVKHAVEFGHSVDQLLVVASADDARHPIVLLLVERGASNLSVDRIENMGGEPRGLVTLDGVRVDREKAIVLGEADLALMMEMLERLRLLRAAELIGVAETALNLAVDYSKTRVQYGRPIGSFQAIQHKLANMATLLELARWPVYYAAWRLDEGLDADAQVAKSLAKVGEMARVVTAEAVQTHGGNGVMEDSDVGLYYRRAKARQLELGYPDQIRERVAVALGL